VKFLLNNQTEIIMKASFLIQSTEYLTDPTFSKFIPRTVRKTLRLSPAKRNATNNTSGHTSLTHYFTTAYRTSSYFAQNLCETEPYTDEFGDCDNEYEGLTITEPMSEAELWKFCTGYDVI